MFVYPVAAVRGWVSSAAVAGAAFAPTDIAGLVLWLDFSDISTLYQDAAKTTPVASDGDVIGAAEDKSGGGKDHTQTTTATKPTYKTGIQNSLSIGRADGGDELRTLTNTLNQPMTILAVCMSTVAGADYIFGETTRTGISTLNRTAVYAGAFLRSSVDAFVPNTYFQPTYVLNGASSILRVNTNQVASGNLGTSNNTKTSLFSRLGADFWNGDIGEICIYSSVLSGDDITLWETYANDKWSVY